MPEQSPHTRGVLVYDGDCGFCGWVVSHLRRWVRPAIDIIPSQSADLGSLGLTHQECIDAVQWVAPDGRRSSGGSAACDVLRASPRPWPVLGVLGSLPGIRLLVDVAYRWVARNRHRLPGSTTACQPPASPVGWTNAPVSEVANQRAQTRPTRT